MTLIAFVGVALFAMLGRSAQSPTPRLRLPRVPSLAAGAATSQIAFMRDTYAQAHKELYVMNADGSGQRLLARGAWEDIAWSPDGREIAFLRVGAGEKPGLYVVKADGSGERRLTRDAQASGLAWTPDGQTIAFTRVRGGYRDVYVMNADGSGQRRLVQRGISRAGRPTGS